MLNTEIWKKVNNLPYEISNLGDIKRSSDAKYKHKGRGCIKPYINRTNYLAVNLYKNSKVHKFLLHRLLAIMFIPNPNEYPCINHKDGNRQNNALDNLEWCTHSQNIKHAWDIGLVKNRHANASTKRKDSSSKYKGVSWIKARSKWFACIGYKGKTYGLGKFTDEIEAAKAYDAFILEKNLIEKGYSINFS